MPHTELPTDPNLDPVAVVSLLSQVRTTRDELFRVAVEAKTLEERSDNPDVRAIAALLRRACFSITSTVELTKALGLRRKRTIWERVRAAWRALR